MTKFTVAELVTGDLIKLNGEKGEDDRYVRVFLNTNNGNIVSGDTWLPLDNYSDNELFNWNKPNTFGSSFVEVWRPKSNMSFKENTPGEHTHTLIWRKHVKTEEEIKIGLIESRINELKESLAALYFELGELKGSCA